jgi:hypothetical protein
MTSGARYDDDISRRLAADEIDRLTAAQMRSQNLPEDRTADGARRAQPGTAASAAGAQSPGKNAKEERDTGQTLLRPHYSVRRVLCGAWWALGTLLFGISALISLFGGHFLQFLGAAALAGLVGWYDYRVWTFKAKWLMFLIIF